MLELKSVSCGYENNSVLNDVSCTINTGDCITIIGHNGTGKSTLFDVISGRLNAQAGTITINGKDVTHLREVERVGMIGRLFQNPSLNLAPSMSVHDNIVVTLTKSKRAKLRSASIPPIIIKNLIEMLPFNIVDYLSSPAHSLSGGQRQLLAFALLILTKPAVLLLDEPTAALDTNAATQLLRLVQKNSKKYGIPTLIITHDPIIAQHVGNRLWEIANGTIAKEYGEEKRTLPLYNIMTEIDIASLDF